MPYVPVDAREAALLETIGRRPEDLQLRVVYADWLEERGDRKRATLVRLWLESVAIQAMHDRPLDARDFHVEARDLDRRWQRLVFDPPIPLERRRDRRWLAALLGGKEERAAMGGEAPPSLLEDAVFDANLLWGWPSSVLYRLAFAVARDVIEVVGASGRIRNLPHEELLLLIERVEAAAASGATTVDVERVEPRSNLVSNRDWSAGQQAYNLVVDFPARLSKMLASYQGSRLLTPRPSLVAGLVADAARARIQLGWAARGFEHAHAKKDQAVRVAEAAAVRAEKAQRALESKPPRLEVFGLDATRLVEDLRRRRDRARELARLARASADALVAACPVPPAFEGELRELFRRVGPELVRWLRTEEDFLPEPLVVSESLVETDERGWRWRVTYDRDGRHTSKFVF